MRKITTAMILGLLLAGTAPAVPANDLDEAVSWLAVREGGLVDLRPSAPAATSRAVMDMVDASRAKGRKVWMLILPAEDDLSAALSNAAGRLAPGPRDMVIVASRAGVMARVPALAGHPSAIDAAFESSRRQLAADLGEGLVIFVKNIEQAQSDRQRMVRLLLGVVALIFVAILLHALRSFGVFRQQQGRWEREDRGRHRDLVQACQERLQRLSTPGAVRDPAVYDECYRELQELSGQEPADSSAALALLCQKMDQILEDGKAT